MRCNLRSSAEYETKAPIRVYPKLLDIIHCPRKDGASVMKVLDQQFESVGASHHDFVSGSGDGGGENEGVFKHFPLFCTQTHVKQLAAHKQADKDNSNQTNERTKEDGRLQCCLPCCHPSRCKCFFSKHWFWSEAYGSQCANERTKKQVMVGKLKNISLSICPPSVVRNCF